jgi:hypothetical protein
MLSDLSGKLVKLTKSENTIQYRRDDNECRAPHRASELV